MVTSARQKFWEVGFVLTILKNNCLDLLLLDPRNPLEGELLPRPTRRFVTDTSGISLDTICSRSLGWWTLFCFFFSGTSGTNSTTSFLILESSSPTLYLYFACTSLSSSSPPVLYLYFEPSPLTLFSLSVGNSLSSSYSLSCRRVSRWVGEVRGGRSKNKQSGCYKGKGSKPPHRLHRLQCHHCVTKSNSNALFLGTPNCLNPNWCNKFDFWNPSEILLLGGETSPWEYRQK